MAEVIGLLASILQVSSFGLLLGQTLSNYGSSVAGADKRLKGLDKDINFTSHVITELGALLKDPRIQALVSERSISLAIDAVAECDAIFQAMEDVIANIRRNGKGKWKIYFRESKIELLRSNLDRMKGNLQLLLQVITSASQLTSDKPSEATMAAHRAKIRELMFEKELYTQRYLQEKSKYDELLTRINSTSTFSSISTVQTGLSENQLRILSTSTIVNDSQARIGEPVSYSEQSGSQSETTIPQKVELSGQTNLAAQLAGPSTSSIDPTIIPRPPPVAHLPSNVQGIDSNRIETQAIAQNSPCSHPQAPAQGRERGRSSRFPNSTRNFAKGVKSATTKTLTVALYPIRAVISKYRRYGAMPKSFTNSASRYQPSQFEVASSPTADVNGAYNYFGPRFIPSIPGPGNTYQQAIPYHSTQIRAELPGPHEMPDHISVESSLIHELIGPSVPKLPGAKPYTTSDPLFQDDGEYRIG